MSAPTTPSDRTEPSEADRALAAEITEPHYAISNQGVQLIDRRGEMNLCPLDNRSPTDLS